jgi:succinoglycan biosynthesis protein ExoM
MYTTVCIATHKRHLSLERLLDSLTSQKAASPFEVVVVDNDQEKSGQKVAFRFRDKLPLTYLVESVRGIARTRNRAVAISRSPFLAFIDDDEWATPQWLAELERRQNIAAADVVIGRIERKFDAQVSDLVRRCGMFDPSPLPDGAITPWYYAYTSNAFVRREALPDREKPFSTRFDLTGGSDIDLFKRMIESGARVVTSQTAIVFEQRPVARANLLWVFRRAMRNGVTIAELDRNEMSAATRVRRALRLGWGGVGDPALADPTAITDFHWLAKAGRHLIRGGNKIGKLLHILGMRIEEYRHHP